MLEDMRRFSTFDKASVFIMFALCGLMLVGPVALSFASLFGVVVLLVRLVFRHNDLL